MKKAIFGLSLMFVLSTITFAQSVSNFNITEKMVNDAQKGWCGALVKINETKEKGGDFKKVASDTIDAAYFYQNGPVLFKPTLTTGDQTFRMDKEGNLRIVLHHSSLPYKAAEAAKATAGKTKKAGKPARKTE